MYVKAESKNQFLGVVFKTAIFSPNMCGLAYPFSRQNNSSMKIKTLNFQTIQIQITLL